MAFKLFSKNPVGFSQEKKQQTMIVSLVVVALITVAVLYFGFLRPSSTSVPSEGIGEAGHEGIPAAGQEDIPMAGQEGIAGESGWENILAGTEGIVEKINFDVGFLKEESFRALKSYGQWPIEIGEKGRSNPFLPY
jgi:hypothetical protein